MTLWHLHESGLARLEAHLVAHPPTLALEVGSGDSTLILVAHVEHLVTLEHLEFYSAAVRGRLLAEHLTADVRLCVMAPLDTPEGPFPWYATDLPDAIDFAFIDGPPLSIGRQAALFAIWPHLAPGAEVWLDDAHREHERHCLALWAEHLPIAVEPVDGRLVRITRREGES